jgi:hypothetical protein
MMALFEAGHWWQALVAVVAVFGFVPGFVLRLLLKIYPRDDPRRQELLAALYTLPRGTRPFFVAEQLETVLFEGLPLRVSARLRQRRGRKFDRRLAHMVAQLLPSDRRSFPLEPDLVLTSLVAREHVFIQWQPSSGKTAQICTLVSLVPHSARIAGFPLIPALCRLRDWNPETTSLQDLVVEQLSGSGITSRRFARELVNRNHVVLVLDGLDSPAQTLRASKEWAGQPAVVMHHLPLMNLGTSGSNLPAH